MIISVGVKPKPFRPMRPRRAQRPVEQERPKPLALKSWDQPEVDKLDSRFADMVELAESTGLAIEAQHVDMRGIVGEQRFEFRFRHPQALVPLHRSANRAVEIEISGRIEPFARHDGAGQR